MTPERRDALRAAYGSDSIGVGRDVRELLDALDAAEKCSAITAQKCQHCGRDMIQRAVCPDSTPNAGECEPCSGCADLKKRVGELEKLARRGWETARFLAIACNAQSTEVAANQALLTIGESEALKGGTR